MYKHFRQIVSNTVKFAHIKLPVGGHNMGSAKALYELMPKVLVFDLDGCVWNPEMYELWGGGGAPFKARQDGNLSDRAGTIVRLIGDVGQIMSEFKTDSKWEGSVIAVASSCDEPTWARECIQKFPVGGQGDKLKLKDVSEHETLGS